MIYQFIALLSVLTAPQSVLSFSSPLAFRSGSSRSAKTSELWSSYLDSLNDGVATIRPAEEEEVIPAATIGPFPIVSDSESDSESESEVSLPPFAHTSIGYFGLEELTSKGPRTTADWGTPEESTRPILPLQYHDGQMLTAGSWYCTEGGWPSPSLKAHTEVFYVLDGHCSMDDLDGTKHYFGPGDTVIIPKGHSGRWDVHQPVHKVWTSHHHPHIENQDPRVQVIPYSSLSPPTTATSTSTQPDVLYGTPSTNGLESCQTFYNVGPTKVGVWNCAQPSSFQVIDTQQSIFFHLLEGIMYLSDAQTGHARRCIPGDTVLLPAHWSGHIDILTPVKKVWTSAALSNPTKYNFNESGIIDWTPDHRKKV